MEGFYRKKGVEGALVEEKAFFLDLGFFLVGEESGNRKGFIIQIASFSFGGWCGDDPHDRQITGAWAENFRLVKILFLGEVETTIKPGIKSLFGIMGFSTSDTLVLRFTLWQT